MRSLIVGDSSGTYLSVILLNVAQTTANVLQFFAVRTLKHDAVPHSHSSGSANGGTQTDLKRMHVFLERSLAIEGAAMAADIVGDSRAVLVTAHS